MHVEIPVFKLSDIVIGVISGGINQIEHNLFGMFEV